MLKITILGCGASGGVPLPGCDCNVCSSEITKNNRTRSSIAIEYNSIKILVDAGPDFRAQMLQNKIFNFTDVFYTHYHMDHIAGTDDFRSIYYRTKSQINVYANEETSKVLLDTFGYMIDDSNGLVKNKTKPMYLRTIKEYEIFNIGDLQIEAFTNNHGKISSFGYKIGNFAYSTDVKFLYEKSKKILKGNLDTWLISLTNIEGNDAHASLAEVLSMIDEINPRRVILTHMNHQLDYNELKKMLNNNIEPGYDGMILYC